MKTGIITIIIVGVYLFLLQTLMIEIIKANVIKTLIEQGF